MTIFILLPKIRREEYGLIQKMPAFIAYNGETFKNYTDADGISDLKIIALKTDPLGNIIIVNKKGIDILNPETESITYLTSITTRALPK